MKNKITIPFDKTYFRILGSSTEKDEKIITIGLVSSITDSYETVIVPAGCLSPLESVPVDFNHNRISTGAYMKDLGIQKATAPDGIGGLEDIEVRMVEVHVPKTARAWTQQNKDKPIDEVASLYDFIEAGRVGWGSVDFEPIPSKIERVMNVAGELIREVYTQWRLNFFSLLDTKPGQDTSYFINIRSLDFKRKKMDLGTVKEKLSTYLQGKEIAFKSLDNIKLKLVSDTDGEVEFSLNGEKDYVVPYTASQDGDITIADKLQEQSEGTDTKAEDTKDDDGNTEESSIKQNVKNANGKNVADAEGVEVAQAKADVAKQAATPEINNPTAEEKAAEAEAQVVDDTDIQKGMEEAAKESEVKPTEGAAVTSVGGDNGSREVENTTSSISNSETNTMKKTSQSIRMLRYGPECGYGCQLGSLVKNDVGQFGVVTGYAAKTTQVVENGETEMESVMAIQIQVLDLAGTVVVTNMPIQYESDPEEVEEELTGEAEAEVNEWFYANPGEVFIWLLNEHKETMVKVQSMLATQSMGMVTGRKADAKEADQKDPDADGDDDTDPKKDTDEEGDGEEDATKKKAAVADEKKRELQLKEKEAIIEDKDEKIRTLKKIINSPTVQNTTRGGSNIEGSVDGEDQIDRDSLNTKDAPKEETYGERMERARVLKKQF